MDLRWKAPDLPLFTGTLPALCIYVSPTHSGTLTWSLWKETIQKSINYTPLLMVNPDCLLTWEQSKPTSTGVTFQGALSKRYFTHIHIFYYEMPSQPQDNIWLNVNCLFNHSYSTTALTADEKSFRGRLSHSHQWNRLEATQPLLFPLW